MLEATNRTYTFAALLQLLREPPREVNTQQVGGMQGGVLCSWAVPVRPAASPGLSPCLAREKKMSCGTLRVTAGQRQAWRAGSFPA